MAGIADFQGPMDPAAIFQMLQQRFNGTPGTNVGGQPSPGTLEQMQRAVPPQPAPQQRGLLDMNDMGAAAGGAGLPMPPQAPQAAPQQPQMPGFLQSSGFGPLDKMHQFITENRGAMSGIGAAIQSGRPVGYGAMQGAELDKKRKDEEEQKQREKVFADATGEFLKDNPALARLLKADPKRAPLILELAEKDKERNTLTAYQKAQIDLDNKRLAGSGDSATADVKNYQVYARETAASGGKPMSFLEYQTTLKSAGRTNNTVTMSGETEFEKTMGKQQGEMFTGMMKDGINAKNDLALVDRLEQNLQGLPGGVVGALQGVASDYGVKVGPDSDKVEVAKAVIAKLVPAQRIEGSGTTSDRDIALFQQAVPKLSNTPDGNRLIVQTMRGLAQYKQQQGQIATAVASGQISRKEALDALAKLPDPLSEFKAATSGGGASGQPAAGSAQPKASGEYKNGQIIVNPKTGERRQYQDGQWRPL